MEGHQRSGTSLPSGQSTTMFILTTVAGSSKCQDYLIFINVTSLLLASRRYSKIYSNLSLKSQRTQIHTQLCIDSYSKYNKWEIEYKITNHQKSFLQFLSRLDKEHLMINSFECSLYNKYTYNYWLAFLLYLVTTYCSPLFDSLWKQQNFLLRYSLICFMRSAM